MNMNALITLILSLLAIGHASARLESSQFHRILAKPPRCGDGVCNGSETCTSCEADCGCGEGETCTEGACVSQLLVFVETEHAMPQRTARAVIVAARLGRRVMLVNVSFVATELVMARRTVHLVLPIVALVPIVPSRQHRVYAQMALRLRHALPTKIVSGVWDLFEWS